MADVIPLHPADPPCDTEYEPQRKALEEHMEAKIPMERREISEQTQRKLTAASIFRASSALEDGPPEWLEDALWAWRWFRRLLIVVGLFVVAANAWRWVNMGVG